MRDFLHLSRAGVLLTIGVYGLALIILGVMGWQHTISVAILTTDPAAISDFPFYTGLLSNIGIITWTSTSAICLFAAGIVKEKQQRLFLTACGLLTLILMLDDQFMLHEEVFPDYLQLPGLVLYVFYGLSLALIIGVFYRLILATNPVLFILPLAFFAASVAAEPITQRMLLVAHPLLFEDGTKFIGIIGWFNYFALYCRRQLLAEMEVA